MDYVEIPMDTYIQLLEERRLVIEPRGWVIPDCVWDYFLDIIRECGIDKDHSDPAIIVDNVAINGDYGCYDEYKQPGETDEMFEARAEQNEWTLLQEEDGTKYVVLSL